MNKIFIGNSYARVSRTWITQSSGVLKKAASIVSSSLRTLFSEKLTANVEVHSAWCARLSPILLVTVLMRYDGRINSPQNPKMYYGLWLIPKLVQNVKSALKKIRDAIIWRVDSAITNSAGYVWLSGQPMVQQLVGFTNVTNMRRR